MTKTVFFSAFFACTIFFSAQVTGDDEDDFWLLLDYYEPLQNALWFYGGLDELDGNYYGLSADLAIVDELHFNFSATEQNYSVATTDLRWGFSGPLNRNFSWAISKTFWGKKDKLEKNDLVFSLSSFYDRFNVRVSFERGDIELFLRDSLFIQRESISSDHRAAELSSGYSWTYFYTQLSFKQHDYEKDLTLLLLPRLFRLVNPVGIQQASALAETEANVLFGMRVDDMAYELSLSKIKSAVTEEKNTYATLRLSKTLTRYLTLGVDAELPVDDVPFSAGLSVGILW